MSVCRRRPSACGSPTACGRPATGDLGSRGWIAEDAGLIKLVADVDRGVLVGGTVAGSMGGAVLSLIVTAIHARIPIATLAEMHFAYPTFHRALQPLLRELHRPARI